MSNSKDPFLELIEELHKLRWETMVYTALKSTRCIKEAEEIVSDVFEKVLIRKPKISSLSDGAKYMNTCLQNKLKNYMKKRKRNKEISADIYEVFKESGERNLADFQMTENIYKFYRIGMAQLNDKERSIILEHDSGTSMSEIARKKGLVLNSAYNEKSKAIRKLKDIILDLISNFFTIGTLLLMQQTADISL